MGDRGQICVTESDQTEEKYDVTKGVYLYTFFGAFELVKTLQRAIAKRLRWDDAEYLARIIFDTMKEGCRSDETGYGISTTKNGDVDRVIYVDCKNQRIIVDDGSFAGSFEEFLKFKDNV